MSTKKVTAAESKRTHRDHHIFLSNFLIMAGIIEHAAILTQLILSFTQGTIAMIPFIIIIYRVFVASSINFFI